MSKCSIPVKSNTAAVVVLYKPDKGLYDRLKRINTQVDTLIIVSNDCTRPECINRLDKNSIIWIENENNLGSALNIGLNEALKLKYKWCFLFDQDTTVFSNILFEMSYTHEPKNLFDLVIEMQLAGYKPVLAHPERYHFMNKGHEIYHRLKEAKVLFQVNLLSFTDYYSKTIQKNALWLSNEKMIDFLGSDVHKMKHIDNIEVLKSKNILQNVIRENSLKNKFL